MLSEADKRNFETIVRAIKNDDVALMECTLNATGEAVPVICACFIDEEENVNMVPFAQLFSGNPYEILEPPAEPDAPSHQKDSAPS